MSNNQGFGGGSSFNLQGFGGSGGFPGMASLNSASASNNGSGGGQAQAIESLTLTAQSVGLTVEQLAAALASSPNLKTLSPENGNSDGHRDLALSLYRTESLALYRRCMLLAGFDPSGIEETSPEYLQFAFKAWQEEGKRLQDLLGMEMSMQAPVVANISLQEQQQQEAAQAHAHAQVQAQVQAQAVQNQAKALALEQRQQQQQLLLQNHLQEQQNSGLKSLLYNQSQSQQNTSQQMYSDAVQQKLTGMQLLSNSKNNFM